jgi:hypothetical protein
MPKKHTTLHNIINELVDRTNTDTQRIRQLESWEKGLNMRIESIEQEILNINNTTQKTINDLEAGLKKRDQNINELQLMIKEIIKQLKRFVRTEKISELETMLDIYSPLKSNFMTREEVEQLIAKRIPAKSKKH